MPQVTVKSDWPAAAIDLGSGGGAAVNDGPSTVYYRDEMPVDATANDGSLVSGASVALAGVQFLASNGRASVHYSPSATATASTGVTSILPAAKLSTIGGRGLVPVAHTTANSGADISNGTDIIGTMQQTFTLSGDCRNLSFVDIGYYNANYTLAPNEYYVKYAIQIITTGGTFYVPATYPDGAITGRVDPGTIIATLPVDLDLIFNGTTPPYMTDTATLTIRKVVSVDTVGKKWPTNKHGGTGDRYEAGVDKLMTGTVGVADGGEQTVPWLILGEFIGASVASLALYGDSIGTPLTNGPSSALGIAMPGVPIVNLSVQAERGDEIYKFPHTHTVRQILGSHAKNALYQYGFNDGALVSSDTSGLMKLHMLTWAERQYRRGIKAFACTITPKTTSTDSWATVGNQTFANSFYQSSRVLYNDWLRDGSPIDSTTRAAVAIGASGLRAGQATHPLAYAGCPAGPGCTYPGYFDHADALESARNSGKFKVGGLTTDGSHPSGASAIALQATAFSATPLAT